MSTHAPQPALYQAPPPHYAPAAQYAPPAGSQAAQQLLTANAGDPSNTNGHHIPTTNAAANVDVVVQIPGNAGALGKTLQAFCTELLQLSQQQSGGTLLQRRLLRADPQGFVRVTVQLKPGQGLSAATSSANRSEDLMYQVVGILQDPAQIIEEVQEAAATLVGTTTTASDANGTATAAALSGTTATANTATATAVTAGMDMLHISSDLHTRYGGYLPPLSGAGAGAAATSAAMMPNVPIPIPIPIHVPAPPHDAAAATTASSSHVSAADTHAFTYGAGGVASGAEATMWAQAPSTYEDSTAFSTTWPVVAGSYDADWSAAAAADGYAQYDGYTDMAVPEAGMAPTTTAAALDPSAPRERPDTFAAAASAAPGQGTSSSGNGASSAAAGAAGGSQKVQIQRQLDALRADVEDERAGHTVQLGITFLDEAEVPPKNEIRRYMGAFIHGNMIGSDTGNVSVQMVAGTKAQVTIRNTSLNALEWLLEHLPPVSDDGYFVLRYMVQRVKRSAPARLSFFGATRGA